MNKTTFKAIELLKDGCRLAQLMLEHSKYSGSQPRDSEGRFASGGGGGGSPSGSSGGGRNTKPLSLNEYNDKIEGTQAEADREVRRCDVKVREAKVKLEKAEQRQSLGQGKIKSLKSALTEVRSDLKSLKAESKRSQNKIAELKAKLAAMKKEPTEEDLLRSLADAIDDMETVTKGFVRLSARIDKLIAEMK